MVPPIYVLEYGAGNKIKTTKVKLLRYNYAVLTGGERNQIQEIIIKLQKRRAMIDCSKLSPYKAKFG